MTTNIPGSAKRKLIKRGDAIIIAVLLVLALGLHFFYRSAFRKSQLVADIYYKNQLIDTVALVKGQPRDWHYEQNPQLVFTMDNEGAIAFKSSDCPDQVCVHAGLLNSEHAFAACLPNEFLLVLRSPSEAASLPDKTEVDIVN